ncbi:hypothetical protein EW146_g2908 [Bondarzewia mesenterica]|uniref:Polysaccharide biosynthesis domain-containing protein n=1 Tax=Bondarzewia mesenterica TaxID=1095465 RepID=A0A4V3XFL2_9AGAM|nr:hypothetical protein EW146_g2908 [Bondarzewia mesenterica]
MAFSLRFAIMLFTTVFAYVAVFVNAAPLTSRQIGNLQCNIDRLAIVGKLGQTQSSLTDLAGALNGTSDATNVQAVQTSVSGAQGAIGVIAKALLTGQTAPAEARDQVAGNLTAATTTLDAINRHVTDPTASALLGTVQSQLQGAVTAGKGVVSNCNSSLPLVRLLIFNPAMATKFDPNNAQNLVEVEKQLDDEIFEHTLKTFPELAEKHEMITVLDEDWMKSQDGKERWRNFIKDESNTIFVTRIQFYAIEICRNKLGLNDKAHEIAKEEARIQQEKTEKAKAKAAAAAAKKGGK